MSLNNYATKHSVSFYSRRFIYVIYILLCVVCWRKEASLHTVAVTREIQDLIWYILIYQD